MTRCDGCTRPDPAPGHDALPCGREAPEGVADALLQMSQCRQKMVDAMQSGRTDAVAGIARVVFRIGGSFRIA